MHVEFSKWGGSPALDLRRDPARRGRTRRLARWSGQHRDGPARTSTSCSSTRASCSSRPAGPGSLPSTPTRRPAEHTRYEVYIDMSTVPVWDGDTMTAIDLDLDVVRLWDGTVEILDEDEFAEHQVTLGLSARGRRPAPKRSAAECRDLLLRGAEPFVSDLPAVARAASVPTRRDSRGRRRLGAAPGRPRRAARAPARASCRGSRTNRATA